MNLNKFTQRSIDAVSYAQQMAQSEQHPQIMPEHLLAALLKQEDGLVPQILKKLDVDVTLLSEELETSLKMLPRQSGGQLYASSEFTQVLTKAEDQLKQFAAEYVSVAHLL